MTKNTRTKRKERRAKAPAKNSQVAQLAKTLCSVTDPFCVHADGAKDPSGSTANTIGGKSTGVTTITTGTDGAFIVFDPSVGEDCATILTSTSSTFPATATHNTQLTTFPSFAYQYRVVSAGIRWWFAGAATDQGGFIAVVPLDSGSEIMDGVITTSITKWRSQAERTVDIKKPGSYICRRTNEENNFRICGLHDGGEPSGDPVFDNQLPSHQPVFLYIRGKASSDVIILEWVIHYEYTLDMAQAVGMGNPVRENRLVATYQKDHAPGGFIDGHATAVTQHAKSVAVQFANMVISKGASAAANYLFPGSGYAAGPAVGATLEYLEGYQVD